MDEPTRRRLCALIAGLLVADDDLDPAEDALLERVYLKLGLDAGSRKRTFPIVDAREAADALARMPAEVQSYALRVLIEAATVDGKVVPRERRYLETVAQALGVSTAELSERLDKQLAALD